MVDCKQTDGGEDSRWKGNFRWADDLRQANEDFFGNSNFRPNQREAINATMSKKDCFVLMPTGGGAPAALLSFAIYKLDLWQHLLGYAFFLRVSGPCILPCRQTICCSSAEGKDMQSCLSVAAGAQGRACATSCRRCYSLGSPSSYLPWSPSSKTRCGSAFLSSTDARLQAGMRGRNASLRRRTCRPEEAVVHSSGIPLQLITAMQTLPCCAMQLVCPSRRVTFPASAELTNTAQVFHLKEAGIACGYLSGTQDYAESRELLQGLGQSPPAVKILFVTPEKVARSDYLMRTLDGLHSRSLLVRQCCLSTISSEPWLQLGQHESFRHALTQ